MRILTAANENYYGRIMPYLESLSSNSQIPVTLVCVTNTDPLDVKLPGVNSVRLPRVLNDGAPRETECPQHGAWLEVVEGDDNELVIFTDGDIILQRPFTNAELDWLQDFPDGVVGVGYNSGPEETLEVEGRRLFPRFSMDEISTQFPGVFDTPCYNIGVFVARRSTFRRIYAEYTHHWPLVSDAFGHPARQQWLVCWCIARLNLTVDVTPYSFHANGHYGMPPGCYYRDGLLWAGGDVVALRHKL